jgi:hypothetical protein
MLMSFSREPDKFTGSSLVEASSAKSPQTLFAQSAKARIRSLARCWWRDGQIDGL